MPTQRASVLYDVNDFKINKLLTDVTTAPTYSTIVDVPGIASLAISPGLKTAELKGDAKVIAKKGTTDRMACSATYGRLSLDALAVFFGGTVADVTGPPVSVNWTLLGTNALPYFKAQFQTLQGEVADTHVTLYKCQVTGGTFIDQSTDNFGQPKVDFEAIPTTADDKMIMVEFIDTVTPLV